MKEKNPYKQRALPLCWSPIFKDGSFCVGKCNEMAFRRVSSWPSNWPDRFLCIYGPKGSGKTHLSAIWARGAAVLIEKKDILLIKDKPELDKNESLYIIRIHNRYFSEKNFEASLLYLCRAIRDKSAFCLFLAEEAPTKWSVSLPDLRSRVAAVPSEAISLPDDNVLEAVLRKCLSDNELIITHEVAKFIASRIDRSFSYAQLVVNKINELALIAQKSCISYSIAKEALDELEKEKQEK